MLLVLLLCVGDRLARHQQSVVWLWLPLNGDFESVGLGGFVITVQVVGGCRGCVTAGVATITRIDGLLPIVLRTWDGLILCWGLRRGHGPVVWTAEMCFAVGEEELDLLTSRHGCYS